MIPHALPAHRGHGDGPGFAFIHPHLLGLGDPDPLAWGDLCPTSTLGHLLLARPPNPLPAWGPLVIWGDTSCPIGTGWQNNGPGFFAVHLG